ncbi:MAG: FapA family protein [Idiomarina sp.]
MSDGLKFISQAGFVHVEIPHDLDVSAMTIENLENAYRKSDLSKAKVLDNAFQNAVTEARKYRTENPKSKQNLRFKLAEVRDAELTIDIAEDAMEAEAYVTAPYGGTTLSRGHILSCLREQEITAGIRREAIEQLIEHCDTALPGLPLEVTIARGRKPVNGLDARFKPLVPDARKRILRPQDRGDGSVDMRDLGKLFSVKQGEAVLRRIPATKGRPGFTIKGEPLPATDGTDREIKAGNGTLVNPDNSDELIAEKQGMPSFIDNSAEVDEVLTMKDVDVGTGHVDYEGSVIITGSVGEGMRVKATGDITIAGYVDSAELNAGGNITVAKGVIGHQLAHDDEDDDDNFPPLSTRLIASGSVWVSYAQYAMLIGKHGVIVDKQLTHCHVITQGALCVGGEGKNALGKLIGGVVETTSDVSAGQLGAPAGTKTRIYFQQPLDASEADVEINSLRNHLQLSLRTIKKLIVAQQQLAKIPRLNERQQLMQSKITNELAHQQNTIATLRGRLSLVMDTPAPDLQLQVIAGRQLYPGAIVRFEDKFLRVKEHRGGTVIALRQHELIMDVLR